MRILVTGGTGFIGKPLVRVLASDGHDVTVIGREYDEDYPDSASMKTADVSDAVALRKNFGKPDIVYHLAGINDEDDPTMMRTNVLGTENVARLAREKRAKQIIFMSTAGVLGDLKMPAKETASYDPKSKFDRSKAEAEHLIKSSGTSYTIIRAPVIVGPSVMWYKIIQAIRAGYPIMGEGTNKLHLVHVEDVVHMLVLVMNNEKAFNHVFHVASKDLMSYNEVYYTICKALKMDHVPEYKPLQLAYLQAQAHAVKQAVLLKPKEVHMTRQHINTMSRNYALSIKKAQQTLGYSPIYTGPAAINQMVRELQE